MIQFIDPVRFPNLSIFKAKKGKRRQSKKTQGGRADKRRQAETRRATVRERGEPSQESVSEPVSCQQRTADAASQKASQSCVSEQTSPRKQPEPAKLSERASLAVSQAAGHRADNEKTRQDKTTKRNKMER